LTDAILDDLAADIEKSAASDLDYAKRPPVFGFMDSINDASIAELESDIDLVQQNTNASQKDSVAAFLKTRATDRRRDGHWYGGLFDLWAKASLLKEGSGVSLDCALPNGRNHDICLQINNRTFHLESTVITEDEEWQQVWDRFIEAKKDDPEKVLVRPGPFCPEKPKGPSLYYNALRFYTKVYEKITESLDPDRGQCSENEPNVLLISFVGMAAAVNRKGTGWALDELLCDQPRIFGRWIPEQFVDISLEGWVGFAAKEMIRTGRISGQWYCDNSSRIIQAPRRISAVLLFDGCKLLGGRVNYNAKRECVISNADLAALEFLLRTPATYWY
jgi:hypothetical protein